VTSHALQTHEENAAPQTDHPRGLSVGDLFAATLTDRAEASHRLRPPSFNLKCCGHCYFSVAPRSCSALAK
jgi:hypothetical protein